MMLNLVTPKCHIRAIPQGPRQWISLLQAEVWRYFSLASAALRALGRSRKASPSSVYLTRRNYLADQLLHVPGLRLRTSTRTQFVLVKTPQAVVAGQHHYARAWRR